MLSYTSPHTTADLTVKTCLLCNICPKSAMTHPGRSSKGLRHGAHAWKWWEGGQSQSAYWITTLHYIISSSYIMSCVMKRSRMVYRQLYDKIIYIYDYMYHYVSVFVNIYQHAAIISNHLSMPQLNPWSSQTSRDCLVSLPLIPKKPWENPWRSWKYMKLIEDP